MALGGSAGHQTIQRAKDDNRSQNLEEEVMSGKKRTLILQCSVGEFIDKEVVTSQISGELLFPPKAAAPAAPFVWNRGEGLFPGEW